MLSEFMEASQKNLVLPQTARLSTGYGAHRGSLRR